MAHTRKDTLVAPKEHAKHLRRFGKRRQAKAERRAARISLYREAFKSAGR